MLRTPLISILVTIPALLRAQNADQETKAKQAGLQIIPAYTKDVSDMRTRAKSYFNASNFAALETLLTEVRRTNDSDKLYAFYGAVEKGESKTEEAYTFVVTQAQKWATAHQSSVPARVVLSGALMAHGWFLRGDGYANTIRDSVKARITEDFKSALQALKNNEGEGAKYPEWYDQALCVYLALGIDREHFDSVFNEGVKRFPTYWPLYNTKATYLLERWYGQKGEWQAFAKESADKLGGEDGDIIYTSIYWDLKWYDIYYSDPIRLTGMEYQRIKRGFEALIKNYPDNYARVSHLFKAAKEAGDRKTMKEMMGKLGNRIDLYVWKTVADYSQDKKEVGIAN